MLQFQYSKMHVAFPAIFALLFILTTQYKSILILDEAAFDLARSELQYLFVYLYDTSCIQCTQTTMLFHTLYVLSQSKIHSKTETNAKQMDEIFNLSGVQFAEMALQNNEQVFKKQKIDAVPEFRMYFKASKQYLRYTGIEFSYGRLHLLATWAKRISQKYFPKVQTLDKVSIDDKYVIIDCREEELIKKLMSSEAFLQNLEINFICVQKSDLKQGSILLKQSNYTYNLEECFSKQGYDEKYLQKQQQCFNIINNFQYKGLVYWSDELINNLYNKNYSIFILITSNQTNSHQFAKNFTTIKAELDEKQKGNKLPIFAVADIHYDLQGTMRIKKFIGGYDIKGWPYPYPLLAYLKLDEHGQIIKYIYELKYKGMKKTQYSIQEWIDKARSHQLAKQLRGLKAPTQISLIQKPNKNIYKIYLSQLLQLIEIHKKQAQLHPKKPSIYLFVYWRVDWDMQVLNNKLKNWWGQTKYHEIFYNFDLYDNQLPEYIQINAIPAIITFYKDGSFEIHNNIKTLEEIESIVKESNKKYKASKEK